MMTQIPLFTGRFGNLIWVVVYIASSAAAADVEIGGLRNVRASVSRDAQGVICKVNFIPVSCFDTAVNRVVNQQKAQSYALLALAMDLGSRDATVSASDFHPVTPPVIEANRLTVTYQAHDIKRSDEVSTGSVQPRKGHLAFRIASTDGGSHTKNLLSCFDDMRATLITLNSAFQEQVAKIQPSDTIEDIVAEMENCATVAYDTLASEVKGERLLLEIEKDDLSNEIKRSRHSFLQKLERSYATLKKPDKS
jgi:hypothetical protein